MFAAPAQPNGSAHGTAAMAPIWRWHDTPAGAVALLILTTALVRLVLASALGLGIDESYMVAAGRTLRLGYFDHPPAAWWLAWAASQVFGTDAGLAVRLPFIGLFALSTWLMFVLTRRLFGAYAGLWAAAMLNAAPVFGTAAGSWVLPDGPLIAALLGATICLLSALPARGRKAWGWWLATGGFAGIALFSKYTAVLSIAGVVLFLLTERDARRWLGRPHPYVGGFVAITVFSPVLVWNAQNGWVSMLFQFGRASGGRWHPLGPLSTLGGEAAFLLPWIWAPLMILVAAALRNGPRDGRRWLLTCMALPPILLFLIVSLRSRVLFHWAAPGYLMLFPLLGDAIARARRDSKLVRLYLVETAVAVCAGLVIVGTEVRFNWLPEVTGDFALGNDPDLDAVDWTSIRADLTKRELLTPGLFVVAATRWHDAGKIDYALGGRPVLCLGDDPREYGLIAAPSRFAGWDVLIIAPRTTPAKFEQQFGNWFDSIEPLPPTMLSHSGRLAMLLPLFIGRHLHAPVSMAALPSPLVGGHERVR